GIKRRRRGGAWPRRAEFSRARAREAAGCASRASRLRGGRLHPRRTVTVTGAVRLSDAGEQPVPEPLVGHGADEELAGFVLRLAHLRTEGERHGQGEAPSRAVSHLDPA